MKFVATLGAALLCSVLVPQALADTEPRKPDTPPTPNVTAPAPAPIATAPAPELVTRLEGNTPVQTANSPGSIKVYPSF